MTASAKKVARKTRRVKRAKRSRIAQTLVLHHLINPSLKPAQVKALLKQFEALVPEGVIDAEEDK
jgi:hypothetical protein